MPSQEKRTIDPAMEKKTKGRKKATHKMDFNTSLNVACLKRLLPIGLNMFGGREQELVQQAKQMLIEVCKGRGGGGECTGVSLLRVGRVEGCFFGTTWGIEYSSSGSL